MKEKNLYTLLGVVFLALYFVSTLIFIFSLRNEIKVQKAQHLQIFRLGHESRLDNLLDRFIRDSGNMITHVGLSYDQSVITVDLAENWSLLKESYKEKLIKNFGSALFGLYQNAGYASAQVVKFYDSYGPVSEDYRR